MVKTAVADAMNDVYLRLEKLERAAEASKAKGKDGEEEETGEKIDDVSIDWETMGGGDYRGDGETVFVGKDLSTGDEPAGFEKSVEENLRIDDEPVVGGGQIDGKENEYGFEGSGLEKMIDENESGFEGSDLQNIVDDSIWFIEGW
ncbi:predicted protein [Arabidopsis lyrata subsp. lyrata]|uniref:Predicted protein n=1 Tax=Arabidopsis lyrata subsp. lyrata TaxID=81972 RepID=D7LP92_ARALL|nr:predicted protein [Arabidopsis lyrata subsp. lyrata]